MGDDDCFEPAAPTGANPAASVGGMRLHLPLDEDDYLMPCNGQPGGAPVATYMDLVPDTEPSGKPSRRNGGQGQPQTK